MYCIPCGDESTGLRTSLRWLMMITLRFKQRSINVRCVYIHPINFCFIPNGDLFGSALCFAVLQHNPVVWQISGQKSRIHESKEFVE